MQTLSNLRRKSPNALALSLLLVAIIIYEMLSTAFLFLPPLMGVIFTYLVEKRREAEKLLSGVAMPWFATFALLIFAEQLHGFVLFSSAISYLLFYHIFYEWVVINFKARIIQLAIFNGAAYISTYSISNLVLYVLDRELLRYSVEYVYFIIAECMLCLFIFKESKI